MIHFQIFAPPDSSSNGMAPIQPFTKRAGPTVGQAEQRYAHGTRARFILAQCRCFACKVANADYETKRQAEHRKPFRMRCVGGGRVWQVRRTDTGAVILSTPDRAIAKRRRDSLNKKAGSAKPGRELIATRDVLAHLKLLEAAGVGLRAVSIAAGVSRGVLQRMVRGDIRKTRRSTADRILAVGAHDAQPGAYVDAAETWKLLDRLIAYGYKRCWIAQQLGAKGRALQLKRSSVTAENARKVRTLYARLWTGNSELRMHVDPEGEWERARQHDRDLANKPQSVPLSKRDPVIRQRWDALFRDLGAAP
jgi:hypothetical protein